MDEFFRTRMGRAFIEGTMPRIADNLDRLVKAQEETNRLKRIELGLETEEETDKD